MYRQIYVTTGVCKVSQQAIKSKVQFINKQSEDPCAIPLVLCNLTLDEITIRKKIEVLNEKEYGKVELGKGKSATNVLCMVVCIYGSWKIPISYYIVDSLTGQHKRDIFIDAIKAVLKQGQK